MSAALSAERREGWLDFAIVAAFLLIPHSSILWRASSEFGASPLLRAPLFLLPAVLLAVKLARPRPRSRSSVDPVVVFLWIAVLVQGMVMGMIYTRYPANTLLGYAQYFYWFALVGVFIGSVEWRSQQGVFDLMRRYFIAVSAVAWVFAALFLVFGERLPHHSLVMPDGTGGNTLVAEDYYFTLVYSRHSFFGYMVPRFTFLYKEPRVLGMQLAMGLILQLGHLHEHWRSWPGRDRRRSVGVLTLIAGALFWTHSVNGYVFAGFVAAAVAAMGILRTTFWSRFRALHLAAMAVGVGALIAGFVAIGQRRDVAAVLEGAVAQGYVGDPDARGVTPYSIVGKDPELLVSYAGVYLRSPRSVMLFPLGTGIMNLDTDRFMGRYGAPTTQGGTLLQFFAQNAGLPGLAIFCVIAWRLLGRMRRLADGTESWSARYACLLGGFLLAVGSIYVDVISTSAYAPLVFGSIMNLRSES